ncbi:MAG: 4-(cytidine 5'-diphospho)-2-C-methyl-D-erythritol kinase [bacterium]|nr:4-(cytidine 5'-diphospho)-2-C-methyl-D-erythritol kinase [bacterium]
MEQAVAIRAPAKINLGLSVLGKRGDGYHNIRTLFQAVSLSDELKFWPAKEGIELICQGDEKIPSDQENIVWKAARLIMSSYCIPGGVRILIHKRIPLAAGLGGGSSDAAATLRGLTELFHLHLTTDELMAMGKQLGADVPFFLLGHPCALGEGIGAELTPMPPLPDSWIIILNPGFPILTQWVYTKTSLLLTKKSNHINMVQFFLKEHNLSQIGYHLHNDLEAVVIERYPVVAELKNRLFSAGAVGAAMSGSGASVFGIFADRPLAEQAFNLMREEGSGWKVFLTQPLGNTNQLTFYREDGEGRWK